MPSQLEAAPLPRHAPIDDTRLLRAIQTLDDVGGSATCPEGVAKVLTAWAFFLDVTNDLEGDGAETFQQELVLVLEARVLSCVTRFLTGRSRHRTKNDENRPTWREWNCVQDPQKRCVTNVLRAVVCCFLFQLSRHANTAMLVMRSGLFAFLLDECRSLTKVSSSPAYTSTSNNPLCDARDLTIAIDTFDWPTRTLWATLEQDGDVRDAFLVPVGPRTIAHVLRGHKLPANEIEEYGLLHDSRSDLSPTSRMGMRGSKPPANRKPRRLPTMFLFPRSESSAVVCPVCCARHNAAVRATVASVSTALHYATRAVVLLALHIPPTSPEGKKLRRDGAVDVLQLVATPSTADSFTTPPAVENGADPQADGEAEWRAIRAMASAGLRLLESTAANTSSDRQTSPQRQAVSVATTKSPLGDKLKAITEQIRFDAIQQSRIERTAASEAERNALRSRVRDAYNKAMETRAHLLASLAVLSSGRAHPAAHDQSITDWLDSFLTIERKAQRRHEQEALRQRRLLDMQFQIDERRRRERDERSRMAQQDHDTPDTFAAERAEAKRKAVARLRQEMRELQVHEAQGEAAQTEAVARQEAAREDARRRRALTDERRRESHEETLMRKEDHYYALKILHEQRQREALAQQLKLVDPTAEQRKRIERMRKLDDEKKRNAMELAAMRSEDLLARQQRFLEAETLKKQLDRERKARRQMEAEEQLMRVRWKQIDDTLAAQRLAEEKQQRADERRRKRLEQQQWTQYQRAWVSLYDASGNLYYHNQLTGESQWESPVAHQWTGGTTM